MDDSNIKNDADAPLQTTRIADLLGKNRCGPRSGCTRQQQRTEAFARIADHFDQGKVLVKDVKAMVGEDDALCQSLVSVMDTYVKAVADMHERVDRGKRVAEFSLDALRRDQLKKIE